MCNKLICLSVTMCVFCSAFATKNSGVIYGKIVEKEGGNALSYATISVQNHENKILGGATSGENGSFSINSLIFGDCKVRVSFIGYKDTTFTIRIAKDAEKIDLGTILLTSNTVTLSSAVVTGKIPVLEQKLDKLVMNVADAVSTQGCNALDILRKAPGVSIDPSGNILLNGSSVQVWIDNRPSYLSGEELEALLSGTDGSTIDKIEVIAHPSAKYDASGSGGIINIKTRKNFKKGLNGSVRTAYTSAPYSRYHQGVDGTINLNYRSTKNNTTVTYSPKYDEMLSKFTSTTNMGNGLIIKGNTEYDDTQKNQSFKIANDYFANKKNIIGIIISGLDKNSVENTYDPATGNKIYNNGILTEEIKTGIDNKDNFDNFSTNLNYTHIFKENQEVTVNADWGYYDMGKYSMQTNEYFDNKGNSNGESDMFDSNSDQYINIKSIKVDYESPIWKTGKLEAGIKWAETTTENDLVREDRLDGQWVRNEELCSKFNYTEEISAAYISLSKQFNSKWMAKAGLRAEHTGAKGNWISSDMVTTKNYLNLFPTAFVGYTPNDRLRFILSYAYRLERPKFNNLNPFRIYVDASSSLQGNPDLSPEFTHEVSLSVGIGQHVTFSLEDKCTRDVIIENASFDKNTGEKLLMYDNFGKQHFLSGIASLTELSITKWFVLNASMVLANITNKDNDYKSNSFMTQGYLNAGLILPKSYRIEITGWLQSGLPYGYFKIKPMGDFSITARKNLIMDRATLSLNITDILGTLRSKASLKNDQLENYHFESKWRSRQAIISFNYRFGQGKATKHRNVGVSDEAKRVSGNN